MQILVYIYKTNNYGDSTTIMGIRSNNGDLTTRNESPWASKYGDWGYLG
jgi:hypothetical protein